MSHYRAVLCEGPRQAYEVDTWTSQASAAAYSLPIGSSYEERSAAAHPASAAPSQPDARHLWSKRAGGPMNSVGRLNRNLAAGATSAWDRQQPAALAARLHLAAACGRARRVSL
jgi:hypothetical protein